MRVTKLKGCESTTMHSLPSLSGREAAISTRVRHRCCVAIEKPPDERPMAAILIDAMMTAFSVAFLPVIMVVGLSLSAATGHWDGGPIRLGAPKRSYERQESYHRPSRGNVPMQHLLLVQTDPVLDDILDSSARDLSLPASERKRAEALQDLEDERLETCRNTRNFDQCFFFGSARDAAGTYARRAMDGAGPLPPVVGRGASSDIMRVQKGPAGAQTYKSIPSW